jgi:peroxiredoxin Q/BCP
MLGIGDRAPEIELVDDHGARVLLRTLLGRTLVLYFYPKDDTPGCAMEACGFRDAYQDFLDAGADVVGVSSDDAAAHTKFRERHKLPFRLMTDPGGAARKAFGIPSTFGILPGRATFVIAPDGNITYAFNSQFAPHKHIENALAAIK